MGSAKSQMMDEQEFRGKAELMCERAGLVSSCEHGTVFLAGEVPHEERHPAYAKAKEWVDEHPVEDDYESLVAEIDIVLSTPNTHCAACEYEATH